MVISIADAGTREQPLPQGVSPGGALTQGGLTVIIPSPPAHHQVAVHGLRHTVFLDTSEIGMATSEAHAFDELRLLGKGINGTVWLLHFLTYTLEQFDLGTGRRLHRIVRDAEWIQDSSESPDWRYPSLLAAYQTSPDSLWVLGRSLDPDYAQAGASHGHPLAGRESAWNLELELVSATTGSLVSSLALPHWIGGFPSDGLFFFFDEELEARGHIVVTRPRVVQQSESGRR